MAQCFGRADDQPGIQGDDPAQHTYGQDTDSPNQNGQIYGDGAPGSPAASGPTASGRAGG